MSSILSRRPGEEKVAGKGGRKGYESRLEGLKGLKGRKDLIVLRRQEKEGRWRKDIKVAL